MTVTREELNSRTIQLTIVCDPDEVRAGYDRAAKQLAKKVRLPGFRPGHAPKALVEQYIDKSALYDEAIEYVVGGAYRQALKDENLLGETSGQPKFQLTKMDEQSCEFTAKIGLPPVVELGSFDGLQAQRPSTEVSEEEVERAIAQLRGQKGTREPVTERGVGDEDVVVVNIRPDGEEGTGRNFMLISGQTFPQLDEALRGMRIEDAKHLELAFPQGFQEADWAGKTIPATISVNSISAVRTPDLDDVFAQSLQSENVEALRDKVRTALIRAREEAAENTVGEQLLDSLVARSKVEFADNLWEPIAKERLADQRERLEREGKTLEGFVEESGLTMEQFTQGWEESARDNVAKALVIHEVFRSQGLKVEGSDLQAELERMAIDHRMSPKDMMETLEKMGAMDELTNRAVAGKVRRFLAEKAGLLEPAGAGA